MRPLGHFPTGRTVAKIGPATPFLGRGGTLQVIQTVELPR